MRICYNFGRTCETFEIRKESPSVHVIIHGGDDLRSGKTINEVVKEFKQIINFTKNTPKVYMIFIGLIYGKEPQLQLFQECEKSLKNLVKNQGPNIIYVQVQKYLKGSDIYYDNQQLTEKGTEQLFKPLNKALKCVPKAIFHPT